MSYCVNCGVKLEESITRCPLCNTPVVNPTELKSFDAAPPFPERRGQVDVVKRKDFAILLSVVLVSTGLSCGLLNAFVFKGNLWSLLIVGICAIIWVFAIPAVIYTKLPLYVSLLFDGVIVGAYLGIIAYLTPDDRWLFALGLPITLQITILIEVFALLLRTFPVSILSTALYLFAEIAVLCVSIEMLIEHYMSRSIRLSWSAVVLTACSIIVIALITLLSKQRFRDAVRRRLHF